MNSSESLSTDQALLWVRGLLSLAQSDGDYDPKEQALIEDLMRSEGLGTDQSVNTITAAELGQHLDRDHAEDFMRTAVMVALADGVYTDVEDQLLKAYAQALDLKLPALDLLQTTMVSVGSDSSPSLSPPHPDPHGDVLQPMRDWLDGIDVKNRKVAHFLCRLIPAQCPFERDVVVMGRKVVHIPPMCKLNPLYDQVVGLRFRALSYLADKCGEDINRYIGL